MSKYKIIKWRGQLQLITLALPAAILIIIFSYLPMGGIIIAFKDFKYGQGIFGGNFVGLNNFDFFFRSNDAFRVIRNTLLYNAVFIVLNPVFSVSLALLVSIVRKHFITKFYQSTMLLPHLMSWVIVAYISLMVFDYDSGIINRTLQHFSGNPVSWYSEAKYWPYIVVIFNTWKTAGFNCLIYYASIIAIDESLYEAAKMDGATIFQGIRYITIPLISPTIITLSILAVGRIFHGDFGLFYQLPQGSGMLMNVTDIVDTYVVRTLTVTGNPGIAGAVGLLQAVVGLVLVCVTNVIVKKTSEENALF